MTILGQTWACVSSNKSGREAQKTPSAMKTFKDSGKDASISFIGSLLPILKQPFSLAHLTGSSNYIVAFRDHQLTTYEWSVPNRTIDYSSVHTQV